MSKPFRPVQREGVERFGPGEQIADPRPADFILTHGAGVFDALIRVGQGLRIHGQDRKYTHWNHAAMFVGTNGDIVEAVGDGVRLHNISIYKPTEYHVVRISASLLDRDEAVAFAHSCVGEPYGRATIASIALSLLTGAKFSFGFDSEQICSGLVARAMERTPAIFNRAPSHIMPADLAKYYQVDPPPAGTPRGTPPRPV